MELLLLGTAAGEGWPAIFCDCPHCTEARRRGGPNLRTRSGALIDDDFKIDFNGETLQHMQSSRRSLAQLRTLVFTHQHFDHIVAHDLRCVCPPYSQTPPQQPIALYGNKQVLEIVRSEVPPESEAAKYFQLHQFEALEPVTTADGDEILPLPADHVVDAHVLRITRSKERGGKTLFYGHDSGLYPEATLDALGAGPTLDIALLDTTLGGQKTSSRGHMDLDGIIRMAQELQRRGAIVNATRIIATHFSHNGGLLHEELVQALLPHRIEVAFDGMVVRV